LSHRTPVESLESRTLFAGTPLDWPLKEPGAARIGRTLYIAGRDTADLIQINAPTGTTTGKIVVIFNDLKVENDFPQLDAGPLKRVLINGAGGNDQISIGETLTAAFHPRKIVIRGGAGGDTITGGSGAERILGEAGDDIINGGGGPDRIEGGDGVDTIDGGAGGDRLDGGAGDDVITGGTGHDRFYGGLGDDTFHNYETPDQRPAGIEGPADVLFGGDGNDKCDFDPADRPDKDIENPNANV
jgi:Ca2+-binding RTX toxin-like protein